MSASNAVYRHYESSPGWYFVTSSETVEIGPFPSRDDALAFGSRYLIGETVASFATQPTQRLLA